MKLSIVIPCYNESKSVKELLISCEKIVNNNIEIIVVDNGSKDETYSALTKRPLHKNLKIIKLKDNIGYGAGIIEGLKQSRGEIIGWTHADLQTDPIEAIEAYNYYKNELKDGHLVKGVRKNRNYFDVFFTISMSLYVLIRLKQWLFDINAQPKLFKRKLFDEFINPPTDFSLDLYLMSFVKSKGSKILTHPVNFPKRKFGVSKGGGSIKSKINLIIRTIKYVNILKKRKV